MTHLIHCELGGGGADALRRLLGLIELRGFHVASLDMPACATQGAARRRVAVSVSAREPERSVAALARQINRLYGVRLLDTR